MLLAVEFAEARPLFVDRSTSFGEFFRELLESVEEEIGDVIPCDLNQFRVANHAMTVILSGSTSAR